MTTPSKSVTVTTEAKIKKKAPAKKKVKAPKRPQDAPSHEAGHHHASKVEKSHLEQIAEDYAAACKIMAPPKPHSNDHDRVAWINYVKMTQ